MRTFVTGLAALVLVSAPALAQTFNVGDHVEALPMGSEWYPCVVTRGAPNYVVKCTNIDGTTSDYGTSSNRVRADSGQAAALMAQRWAQRFLPGTKVEAAPYGEQNGYHPCTVLSVKGNGTTVGIYHLKCDMGYENGPVEIDVGAIDHIRALTSATAANAAQKQAALDAQNRPPAAVTTGTYTCATFSGGRLELLPGLGITVTGSSSYADSSGNAGSFTYNAATGMALFRGGAWSGVQARYLSLNGGQFKPQVNGRAANTDCNLKR